MAAFSLNLRKKIEPRLVVSGKFDGTHACLAATTLGGNVLVHSPHRETVKIDDHHIDNSRLSWNGELAELNIGVQVQSLCTGHFEEDEKDILFIGTSTHILAYQVEDNSDVFYKEMLDGAYSICLGKLSWLSGRVVVVGGNGSVSVLDRIGVELFWTVMSDMVSALTIFDFDGDGENELITGTDDFRLRVQKEDSVLWETKETASVIILTPLIGKQFAYAVSNGTVGAYDSGQRMWRVKSKHKVVSMKCYDINGDGIIELLTGWSSGKVDARLCETGEIVFRIQLPIAIAALVEADYRKIGKPDLIVVSVTGEVRGYAQGSATETSEPDEAYQKLLIKKQSLQQELRQRTGAVPSFYMGNRLAIVLASKNEAVRLGLAAGPGLAIHCAIVFAEGIFDGETLVAHPNKPSGEMEIALRPPTNGPVDIHVKICVGPPDSEIYQVLEFMKQLPQFCMYEVVDQPKDITEEWKKSTIKFETLDRPQRIALWLSQTLILNKDIEVPISGPDAGTIKIWLQSLRDNKFHFLSVDTGGKMKIHTEDVAFAADIVQSLAVYLGLRELNSEANLPSEEQRLSEILEKLKGFKEIEAKLQAEAAGSMALIKNLLIRLEDARILTNVVDMRRRLTQLKAVNSDLIRDHEIRVKSFKEFSSTLKDLNIGVQNVARLRVGKAAASTITKCRQAILEQDQKTLVLAIRHG